MAVSDSVTRSVVLGQPSWTLRASHVEVSVSEVGAMVAPASFRLGDRTIQPYSVAPWCEEQPGPGTPPVLQSLRGDFFCLPFGTAVPPFRDEEYPIHGEPANEVWRFAGADESPAGKRLRLHLEGRIWPARFEKEIEIHEGQTALYQSVRVRGVDGPMCFGTHPMLKFPQQVGAGLLSFSPWKIGKVYPGEFEQPAHGGYSFLKPGAEFEDLAAVPNLTGGTSDLTRFPVNAGWEDLVMLMADPSHPHAWSAVVFPREGYVWFALKDARVLTGTMLWLSNGGRHYAPWNGRHTAVMGIEELTAYFNLGLEDSSSRNAFSAKGLETSRVLRADEPLEVRTVQGVAPVGPEHGAVKEIAADGDGVRLSFASGPDVRVPLDASYVWR